TSWCRWWSSSPVPAPGDARAVPSRRSAAPGRAVRSIERLPRSLLVAVHRVTFGGTVVPFGAHWRDRGRRGVARVVPVPPSRFESQDRDRLYGRRGQLDGGGAAVALNRPLRAPAVGRSAATEPPKWAQSFT